MFLFGKRRKKRNAHTTQKKICKIKKSSIKGAGKGLFATKNLKKGTKLGEYYGKRLSTAQYSKSVNKNYAWKITYKGKNIYVNAHLRVANNPLRFVNGAKTKAQKKKINTEMYVYRGKVFYRTTKSVPAGEEFIVDYGLNYW